MPNLSHLLMLSKISIWNMHYLDNKIILKYIKLNFQKFYKEKSGFGSLDRGSLQISAQFAGAPSLWSPSVHKCSSLTPTHVSSFCCSLCFYDHIQKLLAQTNVFCFLPVALGCGASHKSAWPTALTSAWPGLEVWPPPATCGHPVFPAPFTEACLGPDVCYWCLCGKSSGCGKVCVWTLHVWRAQYHKTLVERGTSKLPPSSQRWGLVAGSSQPSLVPHRCPWQAEEQLLCQQLTFCAGTLCTRHHAKHFAHVLS